MSGTKITRNLPLSFREAKKSGLQNCVAAEFTRNLLAQRIKQFFTTRLLAASPNSRIVIPDHELDHATARDLGLILIYTGFSKEVSAQHSSSMREWVFYVGGKDKVNYLKETECDAVFHTHPPEEVITSIDELIKLQKEFESFPQRKETDFSFIDIVNAVKEYADGHETILFSEYGEERIRLVGDQLKIQQQAWNTSDSQVFKIDLKEVLARRIAPLIEEIQLVAESYSRMRDLSIRLLGTNEDVRNRELLTLLAERQQEARIMKLKESFAALARQLEDYFERIQNLESTFPGLCAEVISELRSFGFGNGAAVTPASIERPPDIKLLSPVKIPASRYASMVKLLRDKGLVWIFDKIEVTAEELGSQDIIDFALAITKAVSSPFLVGSSHACKMESTFGLNQDWHKEWHKRIKDVSEILVFSDGKEPFKDTTNALRFLAGKGHQKYYIAQEERIMEISLINKPENRAFAPKKIKEIKQKKKMKRIFKFIFPNAVYAGAVSTVLAAGTVLIGSVLKGVPFWATFISLPILGLLSISFGGSLFVLTLYSLDKKALNKVKTEEKDVVLIEENTVNIIERNWDGSIAQETSIPTYEYIRDLLDNLNEQILLEESNLAAIDPLLNTLATQDGEADSKTIKELSEEKRSLKNKIEEYRGLKSYLESLLVPFG